MLVLQTAAEFLAHGFVGKIRHMADHPGHGQSEAGGFRIIIKAVVPFRVGHYRLSGDFVESDVQGTICRGVVARGTAAASISG